MKLDSEYFDKIRIKPERRGARRKTAPPCAHSGCQEEGIYRAPKKQRTGGYLHFCLAHVRDYNKSYDYFNGMSDEEIALYLEKDLTGHRPTWSMGTRSVESRIDEEAAEAAYRMRFSATISSKARNRVHRKNQETTFRGYEKKTVRNEERKAFLTLGLDIDAPPEEIKLRYKELVKQYHPDINGGDPNLGEKLRDVIQAHNHLKSVGLC